MTARPRPAVARVRAGALAGALAGTLGTLAIAPAALASTVRDSTVRDSAVRDSAVRGSSSSAPPSCASPAPTAARRWSAPLDRTVALSARELPLREALDRLAAAARFRLSYAAELLPLDRRVCSAGAATAGDALVALLGSAAVEPVVVGDDQVVLAPSAAPVHAPRATDHAADHAAETVGHLERVIVRETVTGAADRAAPVTRDVVTGAALEERGGDALGAALDAVPGVWSWSRSPTSLLARYGSIRGASSFGVSGPKIYIDGIEAANPLLVSGLAPETIDHVTVVRGPQGSALYGADAIGGVIDVTTRHDGVGAAAPRFLLRSEVGPTQSDFGSDVLGQRHTLALRAGSATRSAGLDVSLASLGDFVPNGSSREAAAHADARLVGARSAVTLTARFLDKTAGVTASPLLPTGTPAMQRATGTATHAGWETYADDGDDARRMLAQHPMYGFADSSTLQSVREYTLGATASLAGGGRWTQQATAGVDGYRLSGATGLVGPFATAADSALRAARGGADRMTLRASSIGHFGDDAASATVTLAAEHSELREATWSDTLLPNGAPARATEVAWRNSTGLLGQTNVAFRNALFVTGGLRLERDAGYGAASTIAALPSLGASVVHDVGGATLKLRTAYGRAIRPPRTAGLIRSTLGPETQGGIEAGADLLFGSVLSLHATRFDQRVTGLVQPVLSFDAPIASAAAGLPAMRRVTLLNAGEIANRGWELEGTARAGRLSLGGTLSLVDSRVARVASSALSGGALRPGDRMLDVPARTATLTADWTTARWSFSTGVARAADWVDYDRLGMARDLLSGALAEPVAGARLRAYERTYGGVTRLRASLSRELGRGLALTVGGDNLLDRQRGEPDDATVVPGRSVTLGIRAKF